MASRPLIKQNPVVTNGDMSASITSTPTNMDQVSILSYGMKWTGSPTGSFDVQVSDDYNDGSNGQTANAGTWNSLPMSAVVSAAGSSGNGFYDIAFTGASWIRLVYTRSGGTGVLNVLCSAKVS